MKMREISRAVDKKLRVKNKLEYQIEALHIYGDEHKESGLKNKVKRLQFSEKIAVPDPVKKTTTQQPMKPFMVNQLTMAFERGRIILSPFDEVLHKQLVDYEVERISQNGTPVYTSKNEHFIDALGLAFLAFALEFPKITQTIKEFENSSKILYSSNGFQAQKAQMDLLDMALNNTKNPWKNIKVDTSGELDRPHFYKVPLGTPLGFYKQNSNTNIGWGSRGGGRPVNRGGNFRRSF